MISADYERVSIVLQRKDGKTRTVHLDGSYRPLGVEMSTTGHEVDVSRGLWLELQHVATTARIEMSGTVAKSAPWRFDVPEAPDSVTREQREVPRGPVTTMADPVAVSTLHARLLAEVPPPLSARGDVSPVSRAQAAVRAVVELHAPSRYWEHDPNSRLVCRGCDLDGYDAENPPWPCSTITAIAHELGVEIGETPT